ncbi:MAG: trypsin-like peptidase domain-containing protein [Flavobacteriales bacterium]
MKHALLCAAIFGVVAHTRAQDHGMHVYEQVSGAVAWVQSTSPDSLHTIRGSGVVLKERNWLVSNFHVWKNGGVLSARLGKVPLRLGRTICADATTDVLVVEVLGTTPPEAWAEVPALHTANGNTLRPGQDGYALGNPNGVEMIITHGLVSGLRPFPTKPSRQLVQYSATTSEGNSGGALVDARGTLIGIPTVWVRNGEGQELNFAIPVEQVVEAAAVGRNDLPTPDTLWLRALWHYRLEEYPVALDLFGKVIKAHGPHEYEAAYFICRYLQRMGILEEAKSGFEKLTNADPLNANSMYRLGEVLMALGDTLGAMEQKARAVRINPDLAAKPPPN